MPNQAVEKASHACGAGQCEEAIDSLEQAVRVDPHDFRLHYRLGICYAGCCRHHPLTAADMAVAYLRQAVRLLGPRGGSLRAEVMEQLGNALVESAAGGRAESLREAIGCHGEAAAIYQGLGQAEDWARLQFNVGNTFCQLAERTGGDGWEGAIAAYRRALTVRTRKSAPEKYAALMENLGTAYRQLPPGDDGGNWKRSIRCYRKALEVWVADRYPEKYAAIENNLGNVFLSIPDRDPRAARRHVLKALEHFGRALELQSPGIGSRAFGITQFNRAQAYMRLAQSAPEVNGKLAADCLEAAARAFRACGEEAYGRLVSEQLTRMAPE